MDKTLLENLQRAVALNPKFAEGHFALGNLFKAQNDIGAALSSYQKAITANPSFEAGYLSVLEIFIVQAKAEKVSEVCRQALTANFKSPALYLRFAQVLMEHGINTPAIDCLERATALDSSNAEAFGRLGHLLVQQYRICDGIVALQKAIELMPQNSRLSYYLFQAYHKAGRLNDAVASLKNSIRLNPGDFETQTALLGTLLYSPDYSKDQIFTDRVAVAERLEAPWREKWGRTARSLNTTRLRIGFVSGDLGNHPVGFFLEGVFRELRRLDQVDLIIYAKDDVRGAITDRIRISAHAWIPVFTLSDDAFEKRIRADKIDILVDLSGHTAFNRLSVFARKPAPIQVTWLGDCATTGLTSTDYIFCDAYGVRDGEEKFYVEKPWFLPHTRLCFTLPTERNAISDLPALRTGHITFGCFNSLIKMNDEVVALWARILNRVPNSRLMLKSLSFYDANIRGVVIARFAVHGIESDRLLLTLGKSREEYFADYNLVDIALDPFPFTGGTTSIDGIWMGVPVITLRGETMGARQGEGILQNLAMQDWIAADEDAYVELAVKKSQDLSSLATLRSELREKFESSPLCDAESFAQNLNDAFKSMWEKFCASH